ncbi:hypothetical protein RFI_38093 [Reticulomyxa filosa]|nr:hypothetical protein RFI_38093 [Reticulomyxa filosa]|eukprot:ETN99388.1 hypothetical protein RFI_38093 [Reticulomyxa filosa]
MFYWLQIVKDKSSFELKKAIDKKVLMLPGKSFYPREEITTRGHVIEDPQEYEKLKKSFVRSAFSIATDDEMKEGIKRFKELLQPSS